MKLYNILKNMIKTNGEDFTNAEIDGKLEDASLYAPVYPPSDYVIEKGTSGIWTYRKWASGFAECWGSKIFTLSSSGSVWVSPAYYYMLTAENYPFTFSSVPIEVAAPIRSSANSFWLFNGDGTTYNNTATHTAPYGIIKINSFTSGSTVTLSYSVFGSWK